MVDRLLAQLRRIGYAPSWLSLVRIAAWFVVGVLVLNALLPQRDRSLAADSYNRRARNEWVRSITAPRGDARSFDATTNDGVFKVAWIGGSELQVIDEGASIYSFLPMQVRDRLTAVDGQPVSIDMYFVSGMRIADEYTAVLAAIDNDVDAIVISLNPIWVLNALSVQSWTNFDPLGARLTSPRPSAWSVAASLYGPSDAFWGWSSNVDVLDDRYSWGVMLQDDIDGLGLLPDAVPAPPANDESLSELDQIRQMSTPMEFWSRYAPAIDQSLTGAARQAAVFATYANSDSVVNSRLVDLIGQAVSDSGIPALVYTAQLNYDVLEDPAVAPQVSAIEQRLARHAGAFDADNVRFDPHTISRRVDGMVFNDIAHVADTGNMPTLLTSDLCALLSDQLHRPDCEEP